tara:strand:+ start:79 stop:525 length:447 start_codon:yes stop_codon:yes gene_type:complete
METLVKQQETEIERLKQRDEDAMEMAIALEERVTVEAQQLDQANRDLTEALQISQKSLKKSEDALKGYRGLALQFGTGASYGDTYGHSDAEIVQFLDTLIEKTEYFHCVNCLEWCHESDWDEDSGSFGIHRCEKCEDLHRRTDDEEVQ